MTFPIRIGVSACLLGEEVRYDGGHTHDHYITDTLGNFFTFLGICPEVGCGLPVPREAMRLEGDSTAPRLMTIRTRRDLTEQMLTYCRAKVKELAKEDLSGFIFKKNSPSSGLFRVKLYYNGMASGTSRGIFADSVVKQFPLLPVEEEGRLYDMAIRENFIERVFAYRRWQDFLQSKGGVGELVEFHTDHKLLTMSHHPKLYRELGQLVANAKGTPKNELLSAYQELFMQALGHQATTRKNVDVLMHMMGYFKKELSKEEKEELLELIRQYHNRLVPLVVPLTLIRHYVRRYDQPYLKRQLYLNPHPAELMLRNHV